MNQTNCQELYRNYEQAVPETLKMLKEGLGITEISKHFGFQTDGFSTWLENNGYRKKRYHRTNNGFPKEVIRQAYEWCSSGMSVAEAARRLNVWRKKLSRQLKEEYDYHTPKDGKKRLDSNYFHEIDTKEKAYWLGYLAADGSNGVNGHIEFSQQAAFKSAVVAFKNAIHSQHKLQEKYVNGHLNYRISFIDKEMSKDLFTLGLTANKTYTLRLPKVPEAFIFDFFRGFMDGDGSINIRQQDGFVTVAFTSASYKMLEDIQATLKKYDIESHIYDTNVGRSSNDNWQLQILGKHAISFLDKCYENSTTKTRLQIKYEKYYFNCRPETKAV